jgi:hypothetical protein
LAPGRGRVCPGISGDIPNTTGVRVFGNRNSLWLDVLSADPDRGLVLEEPAYETEREALVLRCFEDRSLREVGQEPAPLSSAASASGRFSEHFVALLDRFVHKSLQIENLNYPASGTAIILGATAGNDYVKMFSTVLAANHH